ncbi:MAG: AAA family ATPase, partial [Firmicutes bacterium]|nr:AAA family ATPase [Bacillota bacterium]
MTKVLWQRLILRGFGRYREEVSIDINEREVLVLPNEAGKSTLVAGLAAVIFGLPASSDPSRFGQGRYRNWYDPPEFSGELYFRVGSTQYHLKRNFASHQVGLSYYAQGQWVQLPQATGVDNPSATRPFRKYHETLQQLLGISSLDLFLATFCLTQPMPTPEGLDDGVQSLLAGAGSKATQVQQLLENQLRQITRYYGEPLGRSRGGNKDRQLEELQAQIDELTQQIAAGQASSAELQVVQARLAALQQERQHKQDLLAKRNAALQAWSEWRTLAERYQHGLDQQQQVEQALYRARQLEEQVGEVEDQLRAYDLFGDHSLDWDEFLEQQLARQQELERRRQELKELEDQLAQLRVIEEQKQTEYQQREQVLVAGVGEAQEQYAALVAKEDAYDELYQDYQSRFGDLPIEPAQLLSVLQQRTRKSTEERRRRQPAGGAEKPAWVSGLAGMVLGALSYWFWGRTAGVPGLLVALVCCLLGWLWPLVGRTRSKSGSGPDPINLALDRCTDLKA